MSRFVDQIKYTGATINVLPTSDVNNSKEHSNTYKSIKKNIEDAHCEAVSNAPDLSPGEAITISEHISNEDDVSVEKKNALKNTNFIIIILTVQRLLLPLSRTTPSH